MSSAFASRNVLAKVPRSQAQVVAALIRTVFTQVDDTSVRNQFDAISDQLRPNFEAVSDMFDEAKRISAPSPRSLVSTGRKPKSNNPLERVNAEIKRRTRVVGIFPNDASVLRLIIAVCIEQHDEWTASERRYLSEGSMAILTVKDATAALIGKQQALVARSRRR